MSTQATVGDSEFWLLAKRVAASGGTLDSSDTTFSLQSKLTNLAASGGTAGGGGGIPEAPADGQLYGRENSAWVEIPAGGRSNTTLEYTFSTIAASPPTGSQVRVNNADQTLGTLLWVSNTTAPGSDAGIILSLISSGAELLIQDKDDSTKYQLYQASGPSVDKTGYYEIPVTWKKGGSALLAQRVLFGIVGSGSGGGAYIASAGQTPIIPSGYPNANPPDLIDTVGLNRHTGIEPGDVRVYQGLKFASINWSTGLTLNFGAGSLRLNSDANQDLIVSAPDGPNSGKSLNLTNGFVAGAAMARYQSSFTTVREVYCSGWTPGTPVMTPVPDFTPPVSYKSFVKGCWFFLSQYGPAPAGCTVTIYADQTSGTAIPLCAATDISGLTASQVIRPAILAGALATLLIRNTGRGDQANYGAGISAAPSNAGANPAVAWGIEFGIAAYY